MTKPYTDIQTNGKLIALAPPVLKPYLLLARLDRPAGITLLLLPALFAFALGYDSTISLSHLLLLIIYFIIGATLMRAAGCVINDIADRNLDKQVERTQNRPLASGAISLRAALRFLILLLGLAALILFQLPRLSIIIGLSSLPLIALYPLMKRITWWPQAFLGLTFNLSALIAWAALRHELAAPAIAIYLSCIFWTIAYDTIYAHQDIEDDIKAGIKSTARLFSAYSYKICGMFFLISLAFMAKALVLSGKPGFTLVYLLPPALYQVYCMISWRPNSQENSLRIFKEQQIYGFILLLSLFATNL